MYILCTICIMQQLHTFLLPTYVHYIVPQAIYGCHESHHFLCHQDNHFYLQNTSCMEHMISPKWNFWSWWVKNQFGNKNAGVVRWYSITIGRRVVFWATSMSCQIQQLGSVALLLHNTIKWSVILALSFFCAGLVAQGIHATGFKCT